MVTASLPSSFLLTHRLRPLSHSSSFPSPSLAPARFVVTYSYKKFRGRRRPPPRVDRSAPSLPSPALYEEELNLGIPVDLPSDTDTTTLVTAESKNEVVKGKDEAVSEGGALRGLDVLKALQKAVAQKESDSRKGRRRRGAVKSGGKGVEGEENATDVEGDVRPLEIREDWGPRLEFLKKQIQELLEEQMD